MYRPLSLPHPRAWIENRKPFRWDAESKKWIYVHADLDELAAEYESHLFSLMLSHALRLQNMEWSQDDDTLASLTRDLEHHTIAAGRRAGVRFDSRNAHGSHTFAGEVSGRWLRRASATVAQLAVDYWDPAEAERIHAKAVKGGKASHRNRRYTPADLPRGSIKAQAEALGVSRSTIARLRRAARPDAA